MAEKKVNRTVVILCGLAALGCGCRRQAPGPQISEIAIGDTSLESRLLHGFYESTGGWRWASRVFAVSLDPPPRDKDTYLELDFDLPHEVMNAVHRITITARVNGVEVGKQSYDTTGRRIFARLVPDAALHDRPADVEFELDKPAWDQGKNREIGLIAVHVALVPLEGTTAYQEVKSRFAREGYSKIVQQRDLRLPAGDELELMTLFHKLPVWESLWFHNVRVIKNPLDLWMMQQIIYEVRPDFVIETGTWRGGSALYWANVLEGMGLEKSRVVTIDIQDSTQQASTDWLWKKYVDFYLGSSTDPDIVSAIAKRVKGRTAIVTLDSDHAMQHVLRELRMYSPLVSRGSYLVVEDTHMDGVPTHPEEGPGPLAATLEFLQQGGSRQFERDFSREKMVMTFNPGGWLRRK